MGRIDVAAFSNVWVVTAGDPRSSEATIRGMLQRDDGRPVDRDAADQRSRLADDLYAVGLVVALIARRGARLGAAAGVRLQRRCVR